MSEPFHFANEIFKTFGGEWHTKFKPLFQGACVFESITVFLLGLTLLQPVMLTLAGSAFACRRFGLPPETIGIFLGVTYILQTFCNLLGWVTTTLLAHFVNTTEQLKKYWIYIQGSYSMVLLFAHCMLLIRLLIVFSTGIGDKRITTYYWTLVATGYCFGAVNGTIRTMIHPANNTYFNIGFSVTGTCVTCLHLTVKKLLPKGRELSYWTLYCHILFAIILSLTSGIMWTIIVIFDRLGPPKPVYSSDASGYPNLNEALNSAAPFFIMLWGCWGFVFFFYPGISPFSILKFCDCQALMYLCMCVETCIGLSMYALKTYGKIGEKWEANKLGPFSLDSLGVSLSGADNVFKGNSMFSSHVWKSPNFLLWCCFYAGYITVATIFILTMHYPDGVIGKIFFQRKFFIYPMTMFLVFTGNISMNLCWNAIWGNMVGEKGSSPTDSALVSTILGLGELLILLTSRILSEGYLRSFRAGKAAVESGLPYPTDKMGFVSSFFYWVQRGVVGGSKVFVGVFTTDVRTKVMI